jgi:DNA-binding PadR family transcriptional regulator
LELNGAEEAVMIRYAILGLLAEGGVGHGYALVKAFRTRSGLHVATGSFYRELRWLVRRGFIEVDGNNAGPGLRRACYRITAAGRQRFEAWHLNPDMRLQVKCDDELSAQAMFLERADAPAVHNAITAWREALCARSQVLERQRDRALERSKRDEDEGLWVRVFEVERRRLHVVADLQSLDNLRAAYEARKTSASARAQSRPQPVPARRSGRGRVPAASPTRAAHE